MKARVKATGEEIEVIPYSGFDDYDYYEPEEKMPWLKEQLVFDVIDKVPLDELDEVYWEKLKHQYAGMAMQGILSNQEYCKLLIDENQIGSFADDVSRCAKDFATVLVEKLKGE